MNIIQRFTAPTPKYFKNLRNGGFFLTATMLTFLVTGIPEPIETIATYLAVAGGAIATVSQTAVADKRAPNQSKLNNGGGSGIMDPIR